MTTTFVESKDADDTPDNQFLTPSYNLASVSAWVAVTDAIWLQGTINNLTDETYWTWPNVRGRPADDPVIDRYSSPGVNASVALRYRF